MASLNKDVGIHILTSNAEFHPAHLVGDWGDSLVNFLNSLRLVGMSAGSLMYGPHWGSFHCRKQKVGSSS